MGSINDETSGGASPQERTGIDRVCIIGAGPSGLAAAKYLLAETAFSEIQVFEQRANVGGLWNYTSAIDDVVERHRIPQTNPRIGKCQPPRKHRFDADTDPRTHHEDPELVSPVYDQLETNIPRGLMGFSDLKWSEDCQLFPGHATVLGYLEQYAKDVLHLINFRTQVLDVRLDARGKWSVTTQGSHARAPTEWTFDAVIVASGHFDVPYVPRVSGIEEWCDAYPGSIRHSKFYRNSATYADQKVVVVGNSASGVDIASQVTTACKPPLLQSQRSESFLQPDPSPTKVDKPEIVQYIPKGRKVRFADESIETDVDAIIYCTGYFYAFPFLESLDPPVITHGECAENLYQHIFYRPQPTLSFVALNQKIVPFPVAEGQSAVIARVWAGRLGLPSREEMEGWEQDTLHETGGGRNFHVLKFPKDADYINMLHGWAMAADGVPDAEREFHPDRPPRGSVERKSLSMSSGKEPPSWGENEYWTRERFPKIKKAFQSFGEDRQFKRTLEDVGFSFEEWKRQRGEDSRTPL